MSQPEKPLPEAVPIEQALQPDWWETHRQKILIAIGLALVLILGWGAVAWMQMSKTEAARAALANAATIEEYKAVAEDYAGRAEGGTALILMADEQVAAGELDNAFASYADFLKAYPDHPMTPAAKTSQGVVRELQGKNEEALSLYQAVTTTYPKSYITPFAMLAQARLSRVMGDMDASDTMLQNIVTQFPASAFATEAQTLLDNLVRN